MPNFLKESMKLNWKFQGGGGGGGGGGVKAQKTFRGAQVWATILTKSLNVQLVGRN